MKRYLDPKNDLVFRRIFGEHPNLMRAFLNAVLPLEPDERIVSLEYLPPEQVPVIPVLKRSIVDVKCRDERGREFLVEMQMQWTTAFMQRVLFNASCAYVRQLSRGENYHLLQPVIGLSLLNDVFDDTSDRFLHHYRLVNVEDTQRKIDGLQLVFVELPKFHATGTGEAREIWLRFLRETGEKESAPEDLKGTSPEMDEALELAELAAYSRGDLYAYDRYWDAISTEKTLLWGKTKDAEEKGLKAGMQQGLEQGLEQGLQQGIQQGMLAALERLTKSGIPESEARKMLGL